MSWGLCAANLRYSTESADRLDDEWKQRNIFSQWSYVELLRRSSSIDTSAVNSDDGRWHVTSLGSRVHLMLSMNDGQQKTSFKEKFRQFPRFCLPTPMWIHTSILPTRYYNPNQCILHLFTSVLSANFNSSITLVRIEVDLQLLQLSWFKLSGQTTLVAGLLIKSLFFSNRTVQLNYRIRFCRPSGWVLVILMNVIELNLYFVKHSCYTSTFSRYEFHSWIWSGQLGFQRISVWLMMKWCW